MIQKLLTLPFRLGFGAARTAIDISSKTLDFSTKLAGTAIGILRPSGQPTSPARPEPPAEPRSEQATESGTERQETTTLTRPTRKPASPATRVNGHPDAALAPRTPSTPVTPPADQSATPLTAQQDALKTLDDEDEVVAEFAEPGAEAGAGAQLEVEEPWEGYAEMNAEAIISRVGQAAAAELAVVELYEQTHRKRQTVLAAAAKRLRALSPPEGE